jgi:hypothetical protein
MFSNGEYLSRQINNKLPAALNRYESYGILAANMAALRGSFDSIKRAMGDMIGTLSLFSADDYNEAIDSTYDAALSIAQEAINMAILAQHIARQSAFAAAVHEDDKTPPLVAMAEEPEEGTAELPAPVEINI